MKKFFMIIAVFLMSSHLMGAQLAANNKNTRVTRSRLFTGIEYLYWSVSQVNMPYAVTIEDVNKFANFKEIQQQHHWASGFRLTVGTQFCYSADMTLAWTRFHSKFHDSESSKTVIATELLAPNIGFIIGGADAGGPASSKWTLDFDTIDWDFGMPFFYKEVLRVFPFIGLKGILLHQQQNIIYENFLDTNIEARVFASIVEKNDFNGVGPKLGFSVSYLLASKWFLDGVFASSLLYGQQLSPSISSYSEPEIALSYSSKFHTEKWRLVPSLQCYLGLSWHNCICHIPFMLGLGYEAQFFWDVWRTQNSIIQQIFVTDASYGALMFQGITAAFRMYF